MHIAIIDYKCGNIASITNAVRHLGFNPIITSSPDEIQQCHKIILPGVGNYGQGMHHLEAENLHLYLSDLVLEQNVPILGICLGAQLMLETSEESPEQKGLGWIKGKVCKLQDQGGKWRIPHVGWDEAQFLKDSGFKLQVRNHCYYYTHSYAMHLQDRSAVVARCDYSRKFDVMFAKDNIYGCQFHPEKSQKAGLDFLDGFLKHA